MMEDHAGLEYGIDVENDVCRAVGPGGRESSSHGVPEVAVEHEVVSGRADAFPSGLRHFMGSHARTDGVQDVVQPSQAGIRHSARLIGGLSDEDRAHGWGAVALEACAHLKENYIALLQHIALVRGVEDAGSATGRHHGRDAHILAAHPEHDFRRRCCDVIVGRALSCGLDRRGNAHVGDRGGQANLVYLRLRLHLLHIVHDSGRVRERRLWERALYLLVFQRGKSGELQFQRDHGVGEVMKLEYGRDVPHAGMAGGVPSAVDQPGMYERAA